jgi:hypothetical protein
MTGSSVLIGMNPLNGVLTFADTIPGTYNFDGLSYDCSSDTIYGFIAHMDSVNNAELFKIHGPSGNIMHTGRTAIGSGFFAAGTHTHMANGSFYVKSSTSTYLLPDFNVTAPTFAMPSVPNSTLPIFCFAAPRETCIHYVNCVEPNAISGSELLSHGELFPNPVTDGELHVSQPGKFSIQIFDLHGNLVLTAQGVDTQQIYVGGFSSGLYAVVIQNEEGSSVQKLMITN